MKNGRIRKLLSLVLALCMVLTLVPVAARAETMTGGEDENTTVYFQNNWLWNDVSVYYCYENNSYDHAWPGIAMTLVENDGTHDIYSAEIPANATGIIFNGIKNDGTGARDQSPEIEGDSIQGETVCYYMTWSDGNQVETFAYPPAAITDVSITIDGTTYTSSNTSAENPAVIKPNSTISITVYGENFQNLLPSGESKLAFTFFGTNILWLHAGSTHWNIDTENNTAVFVEDEKPADKNTYKKATTAQELKYTNDQGYNHLGTGIYVIYEAPDTVIDDVAELIAAFKNGGEYTLGTDLTLTDEVRVCADTVLDLNSHTITLATDYNEYTMGSIEIGKPNEGISPCGLTVKNGSILSNDSYIGLNYGSLTVESGNYCTVQVHACQNAVLNLNGGTVDTVNVRQNFDGVTARVNMSGTASVQKWMIEGGTFNFDPTGHLYAGYKAVEADNLWTVELDTASVKPTGETYRVYFYNWIAMPEYNLEGFRFYIENSEDPMDLSVSAKDIVVELKDLTDENGANLTFPMTRSTTDDKIWYVDLDTAYQNARFQFHSETNDSYTGLEALPRQDSMIYDPMNYTWSAYTPSEGGEDTPATAVTVYCINSNNWDEVRAYAWGNAGEGLNWPGEVMNKTGETVNGFDVYSITFDVAYEKVIFNSNNGSQTADLTLMDGQYYDLKAAAWYESLEDVPVVDPLATDRYLVGEFNNWNTLANEFKLDAKGGTVGYVSLELEANTTYEFKIVREGAWTSCKTPITGDVTELTFSSSVSDNATITTAEAGTYVFAFGTNNSKLTVTYPKAEPSLFALSGANVKLGETLDMSFYINTKDWQEGCYAIIQRDAAIDSEDATSDPIPFEYYQEADTEYYRVTYPGLPARAMTDTLTVTVYDKDGNQISEPYTDSIQRYAQRMLETAENDSNAKLKAVLLDMLHYGAAAQTYFEYNTNSPANTGLEASSTAPNYPADNTAIVENGEYKGSTISLKSNMVLTLYFANDLSGCTAEATYTDHYGNPKTATTALFQNGDYWGVDISGFAVADGMQDITVTVKDADGNIVAQATDSVIRYLSRMQSKHDPVYDATAKFVTSAYNYFH